MKDNFTDALVKTIFGEYIQNWKVGVEMSQQKDTHSSR